MKAGRQSGPTRLATAARVCSFVSVSAVRFSSHISFFLAYEVLLLLSVLIMFVSLSVNGGVLLSSMDENVQVLFLG